MRKSRLHPTPIQNIDVSRPVARPEGPGACSCQLTLMPWSPFPCSFDAAAYYGLPGHNVSSLCYSDPSKGELRSAAAGVRQPGPAERGAPGSSAFALARSLTTDGYLNLFHGSMPSDLAAACGDAAAGGGRPERLLLRFDFRLAAGRQFDRTYSFQIGHAVVGGGPLVGSSLFGWAANRQLHWSLETSWTQVD
jgi:hypothetical protein